MTKPQPYHCPVCCAESGNFYGRLVFADQDPAEQFCPNHINEAGSEFIQLEPVKEPSE